MTTINLKEFFYWYISDELIEVTEEVAEELRADKRYEFNHRRRMKRTGPTILWMPGTGLSTPSVSMSPPRRSGWRWPTPIRGCAMPSTLCRRFRAGGSTPIICWAAPLRRSQMPRP